MRSLLAAGDKQILINLADVSHMDSSGLGDLVSAFATAKAQGATVKLMHLTPRIDSLLQITKLVTVFEIFESEEQALQSFGASHAVSSGR